VELRDVGLVEIANYGWLRNISIGEESRDVKF